MANNVKSARTDIHVISRSQAKSQRKIPPGYQLSSRPETQTRPPLTFPVSPAFPPPTAQLPPLPSTSRDHPISPLYSTTNRSFPNIVQFPNSSKKSSEASQLRALNQEYQRSASDTRYAPENYGTGKEFSSRSMYYSSKGLRKELDINKALPPPQARSVENPQYSLPKSRNRGFSGSSSHSATQIPSASLRNNSSTLGYQVPEARQTRPRILNDSYRQLDKELSKSDYNQVIESKNSARRDPIPPRCDDEGEEARSSFRSAVTTNSSYLETIGTERSSLLTKRSSRTSIFVRDEGMSVDDAIGMYEQGFPDTNTDTGSDPKSSFRPDLGISEKKEISESESLLNFWVAQQPNDPFLSVPIKTPEREKFESAEIQEFSSVMGQDTLAQEASLSRPITRLTTTQFDNTRDRYGFRKKTQYVTLEEYEAWNEPYMIYLARRKKKWITLMKQHNLPIINPQRFPPKSDRVKRFVRKGIPPSWRGAAWFHYAGGPAMIARNPGVYDDLVMRANAGDVTETDDEIIERDLNRTFPDNIKFKPDEDPMSSSNTEAFETPILQSLRRVLRAFSIYHPKIGYCQSLNFLAGLLLLFMSEENAFWMLNIITRIFLPGTHSITLEGANVDLGVLMSSVQEMMPSVWAKIGNELDGQPAAPSANNSMRLPPITLCTTAWFMSCFIGTLPIESTLRVWDSFFYEGSKTLFRIALTIFKLGEPQIKAVHDPMEIFQVVQGIPRGMMDCNRLMEACFKRRGGFVKLSQDDIERGRAERRRGYAEERERLATGAASTIPMSGTTKAKASSRKGGTLFGRGKKERLRLPVQV
ncbi:GTPase-activating protein [Podosphaera aphanis]|nr:GTPase-activating protein [Podosphaera aphanis]